jgi:hypothetical protein
VAKLGTFMDIKKTTKGVEYYPYDVLDKHLSTQKAKSLEIYVSKKTSKTYIKGIIDGVCTFDYKKWKKENK